MLESILTQRNVKTKTKIAIKSIVTVGIIALAVGLPQLVHLVAGAQGGMIWLPMYLPVLIGGCLLGKWWGLGIGIASPLTSFLITLAGGSPMPTLERLPFMVAELAVFGLVTGLFSKKDCREQMDGISSSIIRTICRKTYLPCSCCHIPKPFEL